MKKILSIALLCSALSMHYADAMIEDVHPELADGVNSYNMLAVFVSLEDTNHHVSKNIYGTKMISRLYTLQGDRLHTPPNIFKQDEATVSVGSGYAATLRLHRLQKNKDVVVDYSVYQQPPWLLSLLSSGTPIQTGTNHSIPVNTEYPLDKVYKKDIQPDGTDVRLMLTIKAVLALQKIALPVNEDDASAV